MKDGAADTKVCSKCGDAKAARCFTKHRGHSDGLSSQCKECKAVWHKENYTKLAIVNRRNWERYTQHRRRQKDYATRYRARRLITEAKRRAKRQGLAFDLDAYASEIKARVDAAKCELSGVDLDLCAVGRKYNSASLDRIVPAAGYVYSNIRVVCVAMNFALNNWGEEPLLKVVNGWLANRSRDTVGVPTVASPGSDGTLIAA